MCGEHVQGRHAENWGVGSSPHVRGTLCLCSLALLLYRFIPACAGNTLSLLIGFTPIPVHPRMCGEHLPGEPHNLLGLGSSPHVRGTLKTPVDELFKGRFIPACAGNTSAPLHPNRSQTVHPRMCGEHYTVTARQAVTGGSSPHVRGTHCHRRRSGCALRFIPACAGNTPRRRRSPAPPSVHPRMCGEHTHAKAIDSAAAGSSPHVRGTRP